MSQQNSDHRMMSFYEHLDELRARLMRSLMVFCVGFVGCYFVAEPILGVLRKPLFDAMPVDQRKLYFTSLFENFMTHLKIGAVAAIFLLSPYFFYQIWAFIAPGLFPKERRLVLPFILSATIFFVGGACFAYFVLFPVGFKYFLTYGGPQDVPLLTIDAYYTTVLKLLLLFGLAFELPVLISLLGYLGVVDAPMLRAQRKTAVVGITVLAAMFAPPDAISMLLLGAPLVLFYEASILMVQWLGVKRSAWRAGEQTDIEPRDPLVGKSKP
ncbi:MAG: twin-arginine translocase subunit TatC [Bdellovibrionota bacterium]